MGEGPGEKFDAEGVMDQSQPRLSKWPRLHFRGLVVEKNHRTRKGVGCPRGPLQRVFCERGRQGQKKDGSDVRPPTPKPAPKRPSPVVLQGSDLSKWEGGESAESGDVGRTKRAFLKNRQGGRREGKSLM